MWGPGLDSLSLKAEWAYMVLPTTSGAPSWPRRAPRENDQASFSCFTLAVVTWFRVL